MPMKPPTTHDSWSRVSERANALERLRSGIPRWISESSDSLPNDCASPAASPRSTAVGSA
jgi:hypothetical protein